MKKSTKAILLTLCAVVLVAASALGTLAYLTDSEAVTNTMTVGKVGLSLDEAKVNEYGEKDGDARVRENKYKLIPGCTYTKDPTIHVSSDSEDCYLFVKVDNGIAEIEDESKSIAEQIETNGWTALGTSYPGIYYKEYDKDADPLVDDFEVFANFTIAGSVDNNTLAKYASKTIVVTAYAVQKAGFGTAKAAWDATFGVPVTP